MPAVHAIAAPWAPGHGTGSFKGSVGARGARDSSTVGARGLSRTHTDAQEPTQPHGDDGNDPHAKGEPA